MLCLGKDVLEDGWMDLAKDVPVDAGARMKCEDVGGEDEMVRR
jgi:hypothetical protein